MNKKYIIAIDQSTQGTKAVLFDENGELIARSDNPHEQIINEKGWVSHDLEEIYHNTLKSVREVIEKSKINKKYISALAITNQRETSAIWNRRTGKPLDKAIVWQCDRAEEICSRISSKETERLIKEKTGLQLSPYFPAAKLAWFMEHIPIAKELSRKEELCLGTMDSWLVYCLTKGKSFRTDYSNASRTQLLNLHTLQWDESLCKLFGIPLSALPQLCDSNAVYGRTDLEGYLEEEVPIHCVMGDSHAALYGHGCFEKGMIKTTYGTGSSIMMNIGELPVILEDGIVTSIGWTINNRTTYVLEGNINYTGGVITWLKNIGLIANAGETEELAKKANPKDQTYFIPAFTGLGAPHWRPEARGTIVGMSRFTGKNELVRAALESIAYQIQDVLEALQKASHIPVNKLCVDGGPTRNPYLMQFQSDISGVSLKVPDVEELSAIGTAYLCGITMGIYQKSVFQNIIYESYEEVMDKECRFQKYEGWKNAIDKIGVKNETTTDS